MKTNFFPIFTLLIAFFLFCTGVSAKENEVTRIIWGSTNGGINAGAATAFIPNADGYKKCVVVFYLCTVETNSFKIGLPAPNQRFTVELFNKNGGKIDKTSRGRDVGQPLSSAKKLSELKGRSVWGFLFPKTTPPLTYSSLNVSEGFKIKTSGDYTLKAEVIVYRIGNTNELLPIRVPLSIAIPLEVEE